MIKKTHYWRGKFDPAWDFIVTKFMTLDGVEFHAGDPFDKTKVPTRRLRQMYETRKLARVEVVDDEADGAETQRVVAHRANVRKLLIEAGVGFVWDDDFVNTVADSADGMDDDEIRSVIAAAGIVGADDDEISEEDEALLTDMIKSAHADLERLHVIAERWAARPERPTEAPAPAAAMQVAATPAAPTDGAAVPAPVVPAPVVPSPVVPGATAKPRAKSKKK